MQVPEELASVLQFILPVVKQFKKEVSSDGWRGELEVRLGQPCENEQGERVWQPNVGPVLFHNLLDLLQAYDGWCRKEVDCDSHDYFYCDMAGSKVRTSVVFGGTHVCVEHMHKVGVAACDIKLLNHACDARVSFKREEAVSVSALPDMVEPYLVRLKKRHSFWLDKWRFDLTQVWSGVTRSIAEANQARGFCTFEVEVECVCSPSLLSTLSAEYVGLSMLLKLWSLLGGGKPVRMLPITA